MMANYREMYKGFQIEKRWSGVCVGTNYRGVNRVVLSAPTIERLKCEIDDHCFSLSSSNEDFARELENKVWRKGGCEAVKNMNDQVDYCICGHLTDIFKECPKCGIKSSIERMNESLKRRRK